MGKSKKGKRTRHMPKARVGVGMGMAGFVGKLMFTTGPGANGGGAPAFNWLMDQSQPLNNRLNFAASSIVANLKQPDTYYPLVAGALASASPRIPIVGTVARPVDNFINKYTHGKWRL